ncbi:MAG: hypothetical protein FWD68_02815 [Alphaproteobacteria bacterium]|nr:hypothetical protein [Alphaproteobacteria bacterium]
MTPVAQTTIDPLRVFIAQHVQGVPVPLVATRFDVVIDGGLAVVTTSRIFRNVESESIEATMTFPVPVHATLFALQLRIGERVLSASAKVRNAARRDYEDALDRGKTAVLHEELLRGVHMLSIGHVAPETEIKVRSSFAVPLTHLGDRATLRIPLTVGDIYGNSPLPSSDDLISGGTLPDADLTVACRDGIVVLRGGTLQEGRARIPLNAPVDLEVTGWAPRELNGRAADGRAVALRIEPSPAGEASLNAAILVDHSGSMGEACASASRAGNKHKVVVSALRKIAATLTLSDLIDLWEFDDVANFVGSTRPGDRRGLLQGTQRSDLARLARTLCGPRGGTNIGGALENVLAASEARDLLLITDGKSYQLDVQALAGRGRRISVVLVGEDSLEANVGHLAALSGGEIFVATGTDLAAAIESALQALRTPHQATTTASGSVPEQLVVRHGGMTLQARWQADDSPAPDPLFARAVAAMAAALALPRLESDHAASLAEAEGLVTHLTSLVLIDEAAAIDSSLPITRKVTLPAPAGACGDTSFMPCLCKPDSLGAGLGSGRNRHVARPARAPLRACAPRSLTSPLGEEDDSFLGGEDIDADALAGSIRWDHAPESLTRGELADLTPAQTTAVLALAARPQVRDLARQLGLTPLLLVIGLLARMVANNNRSAARIARAILGKHQVPDEAELLLD